MFIAFCTVLAQAAAAAELGLEDDQCCSEQFNSAASRAQRVAGPCCHLPCPALGLSQSPGPCSQVFQHLCLPRHLALREDRIPSRKHWGGRIKAAGREGQPVP